MPKICEGVMNREQQTGSLLSKAIEVMVSNSDLCSKQPPAPQVWPLHAPDASDVRL